MNTRLLIPLCAAVALLAACNKRDDSAQPADPGTSTPPPASPDTTTPDSSMPETTPPPAETTPETPPAETEPSTPPPGN